MILRGYIDSDIELELAAWCSLTAIDLAIRDVSLSGTIYDLKAAGSPVTAIGEITHKTIKAHSRIRCDPLQEVQRGLRQ